MADVPLNPSDRDSDALRRDFVRFRDRGDVAALARVFDVPPGAQPSDVELRLPDAWDR